MDWMAKFSSSIDPIVIDVDVENAKSDSRENLPPTVPVHKPSLGKLDPSAAEGSPVGSRPNSGTFRHSNLHSVGTPSSKLSPAHLI